jgi:hypothetical protein
MLTVTDFFNGLRPWEKFTEPKTAAGKRFWETYVQKAESDKKVTEAPDNPVSLWLCCP